MMGECYYLRWLILNNAPSPGETDYIDSAVKAFLKARDIAGGFGFTNEAAEYERKARFVYDKGQELKNRK